MLSFNSVKIIFFILVSNVAMMQGRFQRPLYGHCVFKGAFSGHANFKEGCDGVIVDIYVQPLPSCSHADIDLHHLASNSGDLCDNIGGHFNLTETDDDVGYFGNFQVNHGGELHVHSLQLASELSLIGENSIIGTVLVIHYPKNITCCEIAEATKEMYDEMTSMHVHDHEADEIDNEADEKC